jgi:hypothetical protein
MGQAAFLDERPRAGRGSAEHPRRRQTNGTPNTKWPSYNRVAAQPAEYVGPGQVAWFQFTVKAPMTPGVYVVGLRPVIGERPVDGDVGVFWVVWVKKPDGTMPPPSYRAVRDLLAAQRPADGPGQPNVARRALDVRVDNAPAARPHTGTAQADVILRDARRGRHHAL